MENNKEQFRHSNNSNCKKKKPMLNNNMNNNINSNDKNYKLFLELNNKLSKKQNIECEYTYDNFVSSLNKQIKNPKDFNIMSEYLTRNFEFFNEIENEYYESTSKNKINKLKKILRIIKLENYDQNSTIIYCGEKINKKYFLLNGKISLFKPYPIRKKMSNLDYKNYLIKIKNEEKNIFKLERIIRSNKIGNSDQLFNSNSTISSNSNLSSINNQILIYISNLKPLKKEELILLEEDKKLTEYEFGNEFGDNDLNSTKDKKSEFTIKAGTNCSILTISKDDYRKVMHSLFGNTQDSNLVSILNQNYSPLLLNEFDDFFYYQLITHSEQLILNKGDILYNQNDKNDFIYFLIEGTVEKISKINIETLKPYIDFIAQCPFNLISNLYKGDFVYESDVVNYVTTNLCDKSTIFDENYVLSNFTNQLINKSFIAKIMKYYPDFNILTTHSNLPDIIGLVDAIELRPKLSTVKVTSRTAMILKIKIIDFILIFPNEEINIKKLQVYYENMKKYYISELNHLNNKFVLLEFNKSSKEKKTNECKVNVNEMIQCERGDNNSYRKNITLKVANEKKPLIKENLMSKNYRSSANDLKSCMVPLSLKMFQDKQSENMLKIINNIHIHNTSNNIPIIRPKYTSRNNTNIKNTFLNSINNDYSIKTKTKSLCNSPSRTIMFRSIDRRMDNINRINRINSINGSLQIKNLSKSKNKDKVNIKVNNISLGENVKIIQPFISGTNFFSPKATPFYPKSYLKVLKENQIKMNKISRNSKGGDINLNDNLDDLNRNESNTFVKNASSPMMFNSGRFKMFQKNTYSSKGDNCSIKGMDEYENLFHNSLICRNFAHKVKDFKK